MEVKTAFLDGFIPIAYFSYKRRPAGMNVVDSLAIICVQQYMQNAAGAAAFRKHSDTILRTFGFTLTVYDTRQYMRVLVDRTMACVAVRERDFGIAASSKELKARP